MKLHLIAKQLRQEGQTLINAADALEGRRKPVKSERQLHWTQTPKGRKRFAAIRKKAFASRRAA